MPNDGGPAFPEHSSPGNYSARGMSLRDYFAAAALQGMLANAEEVLTAENKDVPFMLSASAYAYADAMLDARESTSSRSQS